MVEIAIIAALIAVVWWLNFRELVRRVERIEDERDADRLGEVYLAGGSFHGALRLYDPDSVDNRFPIQSTE